MCKQGKQIVFKYVNTYKQVSEIASSSNHDCQLARLSNGSCCNETVEIVNLPEVCIVCIPPSERSIAADKADLACVWPELSLLWQCTFYSSSSKLSHMELLA